MYRMEPAPIPSRKRAYSVCAVVAASQHPSVMVHANSDTELSKFDREKTFETAEAYRQTTDLLAKVVTALATVQPPPEADDAATYGGYHGFSDSQILASEWSFSTLNEHTTPRRPRGRASSDFNIEPPRRPLRVPHNHNEWTWSGDNQQIQEAFNSRYKSQLNGAAGESHVVQLEPEPDSVEEQLKKNSMAGAGAGRVKKFSMPDGLRKLFHRKRPSQDLERKLSVVSVPEGITALPARSPLDYYNNTVTASASQSYLRNGRGPPPPTFESSTSLASSIGNGGITNQGYQLDDSEQATFSSTGAYQRKSAAAAGRRRRESIYTQNPALAARRGSMFPPTAAALTQMQRRGSGSAAMAAVAARRGSLFPAMGGDMPRRSSIFSVTSDKDMDVLEQTTIADLIRALEVVHTHAALDEQQHQQPASGGNKLSKKQRKLGNAGLDPPQLPPILSLFAGDQTRALQATAANRLYARRSTIVGTMSPQGSSIPAGSGASALSNRRPSGVQILEPPPSYTERPLPASAASSTPLGQTKFRRRFSVRPTALQIPPGQAPPPGVSLNEEQTQMSSSQTALQRRLSLRPSPLARELSPGGASPAAGQDEAGASSAARLMPSALMRPSTSSTHSPLSRIVQISQAQRKSSMPEGFATRKPSTNTGGGSGSGTGTGTASDK
ncbi:open rectifier potassium channel protein 1 isoform X3 [Drosophila montana]